MSLKTLLLKQYDRHPRMQIQDMVKLIYQSEFAGGHLIEDEEESLNKLQEECCSLGQHSLHGNKADDADRKISDDAFEYIGSNLCRFHLVALKYSSISLKTVNRFFTCTAGSTRGSIPCFEEKLEVLRQCCEEGYLPFSSDELEAYLSAYKKEGYPPVRHSEIYRAAYSPAYRIVKSGYRDFFEVFCRIDSLMESKDRVNIAIDGNSGAGKSTLAALIGNVYGCGIFHMDDFFLTPELKTEERLKEAGGNVDYVRFRQEVIDGINSGREFQYRAYDCRQMILGQPVLVTPRKLNIIEGSYSMHPTLIDNYDLKIFLHVDEMEQNARILQRNGVDMLKRFLFEWIPLENSYFKEYNIEGQSDLVIRTQ